MFWQRLGLLESKSAAKKFWTIQTKGNGRSFHGKQRSVSEWQCRRFEGGCNKDMGLVTCNANCNMHSPSLAHNRKLRMNVDCSRIVKKIAMVSGIFVEAKGDMNKKDQKKSSKQTSQWLPKLVITSNDASEMQKNKMDRNPPITNHDLFNLFTEVNMGFLGGLLRWLTEQKNPKFLQIIKTISGEQPSSLVQIVQNFFTAGFDSAIVIPYVYVTGQN